MEACRATAAASTTEACAFPARDADVEGGARFVTSQHACSLVGRIPEPCSWFTYIFWRACEGKVAVPEGSVPRFWVRWERG
jgi:hypothetical protein